MTNRSIHSAFCRAGLLSLILLPFFASAQQTRLADLHAALLPLRVRPTAHPDTRGATPQFTVIKHDLRDWIESRLPELTSDVDEVTFSKELNTELAKADLFCPESKGSDADPCGYTDGTFSDLGFLDDVSVHRLGDIVFQRQANGSLQRQQFFLVVTTGVGILCGSDESAYAYEWQAGVGTSPTEVVGGHWQRIWESEQDVDSPKGYKPQHIEQVMISPSPNKRPGDHLILTLGNSPWCSSVWHPAYYRIWHMAPSRAQPLLLVDREKVVDLGAFGPSASVTPVSNPAEQSKAIYDVLIELTVSSNDAAKLTYAMERHYRVEGNEVQRIDPVALSPGDFVDEWLQEPWTEAAAWTEPKSMAALERWHERGPGSGEFDWPPMHCPQTPDLWQISFSPYAKQQPDPTTYFLVRWRPPYHFKMVDISQKPWPGCTEKDPDADEERTLFPVQEWR